METAQNRYLSVMFADDIREEVGGKLSILGIYQAKMYVPELPSTLPKLAILMTAGTPCGNPFKKATFRLFRDDTVVFEFKIPEDGLKKSQEEKEQAANCGLFELQVAQVMAGFKIDAPCKLSAKLETEAEEIEGRILEIDLAPTV
jgi:hypothetical protein